MTKFKIYFLAIFLGLFLGCSSDDQMEEEAEFQEEYSFTIDETSYDFSDFIVNTEWLDSQNRLFISKEDGDDIYNINFPLDLVGANGMNWNNGGVWFFMRTAEGDFYTLDETTSTMNVIEIDTIARTISATFSGIGSQAVSDETVTFSNGVLKAKY